MNKEIFEELISNGMSSTDMSVYFNVSKSTIFRRCKEFGLSIPNKQNECKIQSDVFKNIDNEYKAYWLGFLYADGYVSKDGQIELSLKAEDLNHLIKFNSFMGHIGSPIKKKDVLLNGKIFENYKWTIRNKELVKDLANHGCVNNKSLILEFPELREDLVRHFIRGYFDGDGCVYFSRNGRLCISILGTKSFLLKLKQHVPGLEDIKLVDQKRMKNNVTKSISCGYNSAEKALMYMYDNSNIYLDRKYYRFAVLLRN